MPPPRPVSAQLPTPDPLTIALVGNLASVHLRRWSTALAGRGHRVVEVELAGRHRSPMERILAWARLRTAISSVLREPRSLVALHYVPDGLLASGLRGLHPIVSSVWGADVTGERHDLRGRLQGAQLAAFLRAANSVTATSALLAETVERRFGVRATIVPFGVDTTAFTPRQGDRRPGPIRIGFVKWLEPKYGPDVLLEAAGLLRDRLAFELTFVGDGRLAAALAARATELGLDDRTRFLGTRPHAEIPAILRDLDLFVMPSRYEEFGVAAAEASAAGLPVIATGVGGIPEVVADGETGLLVPPNDPAALADAIEHLAADERRRLEFGAAGRRRISERFDWGICVDRMEAVYRGVVGRR